MKSQDPGEVLYTEIFSVLAPHTDYQQPEFDEATCLTPIEWLYAVTSVALGSFLVSFLQELGKRTAAEVAEYIKRLKKSNESESEQTSKIVVSLFTCEVVPTVASETDKKIVEDALLKSLENTAMALREYRFPEEVVEEVTTKMITEVRDAITRNMGTDPQRD